MWPRKIQNEEVDNDVIEVLSVSSDSDGFPCLPALDFPALDESLTDSGCMCAPLVRSGLPLNSRKASATQMKRYLNAS